MFNEKLNNALVGSIEAHVAALSEFSMLSMTAGKNLGAIGLAAVKECMQVTMTGPQVADVVSQGYFDIVAKSKTQLSDASKAVQSDFERMSVKHGLAIVKADSEMASEVKNTMLASLDSAPEDIRLAFAAGIEATINALGQLRSSQGVAKST